MNISTTSAAEPQKANKVPAITRHQPTDFSRGARRLGIRSRVRIASELLEDYAEADRTLGLNPAGVVLSVLSQHLLTGNAGLWSDKITACLVRKNDGALVDLDIAVQRTRTQGEECFTLRPVRELPAAAAA